MAKISKKINSKVKKTQPEIKAVIFDVGGVLLIGNGRSVHEYMANKLQSGLERWFDTVEPFWSEIIKDESKELSFLTNLTREYKIPPSQMEKLFLKAFRKRFKKNRKLFKITKKLRRRYKTAILSDQTSFSYEAFKKYKLDSLVDVALWSQKERMRKPNPKFYRLLLSRLKIPAKNCVFIDNHEWNLEPAKKLGMHTILFQNNKQIINELKSLGVKW